MSRRIGNARSRRDRDAGLRRIATLTRWSLAGALTGTGLFAGLAAQAGHAGASATAKSITRPAVTSAGATSKPTTSTTNRPRASGTFATTPATNPATVNTQAPIVVPVPSGGSFNVVSGAS